MTTTVRQSTSLDHNGGASSLAQTIDPQCFANLAQAVQKYFDLMYDCDTSRFDQVFRPTVQLHGFRDGQMVAWTAQTYRDILDKRQSPKSLNASRADEILLMDFVSTTMAFVKVRLRINAMVFVDYLTWHCIGGQWLITSKGFHVESGGGSGPT